MHNYELVVFLLVAWILQQEVIVLIVWTQLKQLWGKYIRMQCYCSVVSIQRSEPSATWFAFCVCTGALPYTDSVDVRFMASEGLSAHSFSDVPELSRGIAGSRDKQPSVGRQRKTHDITGVTSKCSCLLTSLNVPQSTTRKQKKHSNFSCNTHNNIWSFMEYFYVSLEIETD